MVGDVCWSKWPEKRWTEVAFIIPMSHFFFLLQILANFINIQFLLCKECKLKSKNKNKQIIKSLKWGEEDDLGIAYRGEDDVAFFLGIKHYLK